MNRRNVLQKGILGAALLAGSGGMLFARRSYGRWAMNSALLADALPPLSATAGQQLNTLPARAREDIKRYFHGKCLNVGGYVTHICSDGFQEQLGLCPTAEEKENSLLIAFCSRVASEAEMVNSVDTIAAEVGSELDDRWAAYCGEVSGKWNARISSSGPPFKADELVDRAGRLIRQEMGQIARTATASHRPSVGETADKIGERAILLMPYSTVRVSAGLPRGVSVEANPVVIPAFFLLAFRPVWEYVLGLLSDRRADCRAAISGRLALLGNRVGTEFERTIRQQITDLQAWQEHSIRETAAQLSQERVGLI